MNYTVYLLASFLFFNFIKAADKAALSEMAIDIAKKQPKKRALVINKPDLLRPLSEYAQQKIEFKQLGLPILPKVAWRHIRDYIDHSHVLGYIKTQMANPITSMMYVSPDTDPDNGEFFFDFAHKPKGTKEPTVTVHKNQLIAKHLSHPEMELHLYIPQKSHILKATLTAQEMNQRNKKDPLIHQVLTIESDPKPEINRFFNRAIEYSL